MGRLKSKNHYEAIRTAQILHNQARLASMGLRKTISELRSMKKSHVRKYQKVDYGSTPQRRSARLNRLIDDSIATSDHIRFRRSNRLRGTHGEPISPHKGKLGLFGKSEEMPSSEREEKRPEVLDRPCASETRISVYPSVSRQKTLCVEEDCKRCGDLDMDQPCLGKTDCSVCHSSNGVLCRACLKVRYGEEMEVVRRNKQWMCPHCIEDKGIKPYWICNSSLCLRKRKKVPTGVAIFKAREMGYRSVAHLLMDELQRTL